MTQKTRAIVPQDSRFITLTNHRNYNGTENIQQNSIQYLQPMTRWMTINKQKRNSSKEYIYKELTYNISYNTGLYTIKLFLNIQKII